MTPANRRLADRIEILVTKALGTRDADELEQVIQDLREALQEHGGQLSDDTGRDLSATLIPHRDDSANRQFTTQLDHSSVPVQVRSSGSHCEGALLTIFARQSYRRAERHPITPAL